MTEKPFDEYHEPERDEFCQRVNFNRVFGEEPEDYAKTLLAVRDAVKNFTLTETLGDLLKGILWSEMTPQAWANTFGISLTQAKSEFDHAYRALKEWAAKGLIVRPYEKT